MTQHLWLFATTLIVPCTVGQTGARAGSGAADRPTEAAAAWQTSYASAMEMAEREQKPLVLLFHTSAEMGWIHALDSAAQAEASLRRRLDQAVVASLPLDSRIRVGGKLTELASHPAFAGLKRQPGIAVIDFRRPDAPHFGRVVRTLPLAAEDSPPAGQLLEAIRDVTSETAAPLHWYTAYAEATEVARSEGRMLLLYFHDPSRAECYRCFEERTLADASIASRLQDFILARLPVDACIRLGGEQTRLLAHRAFGEMQRQPGIAIVDYAHRDAKFHGQVVSTFPFLKGRTYSLGEMAVILDLPPGTLTQRTIIYAVRTHPERPASASGRLDLHLVGAAENHSRHQADIQLQGHHNWENRFHQLNSTLPSGLMASEVCAESWPGEGLLQAAIECVRCWRLSSGHWSKVQAPQPVYGYDMKRGGNGIWYATGIFGNFGF